jgi:Uma2 family endonuclease
MTTAIAKAPPAKTPSKGLMTANAFLRKYGDEKGVELVKGHVVRKPMPGTRHGEVISEAVIILGSFIKSNKLGRIITADSFIRTTTKPDSYRGPDVYFLSYKKWPKSRETPASALEIAPELVVEVKSPSDRWGNIQMKVGEYLNAGVRVVIVLDPHTESASVHRQDELHQLIHNGDELTLSDILPGFAVPVKRFFE